MKAAEVMTTKVLAVRPDTPARSIALMLFRHGISAVPVVDDIGIPIGMVSEGDLLPRDESEREARRDWWLRLLAEGEELSPDFVAHVDRQDRTAAQIMTSPVITIDESADLVDVAELLSANRIKRAPVVHQGRMVGIVSRADLVKAVAYPGGVSEPEPSLDRNTELLFPSERLAALTDRELTTSQPHRWLWKPAMCRRGHSAAWLPTSSRMNWHGGLTRMSCRFRNVATRHASCSQWN